MTHSVEDIWKRWEKDEPIYLELGKTVSALLKNAIFEAGMYAEITYRTKESISILKKLKQKNEKLPYSYEDLRDKLGVRAICNYQEDIPKIQRIIEELFFIEHFENKFEKLEHDALGYTSFHYDLIFKNCRNTNINNLVFELQLRTINQHAWACTAHELSYKQEIELPKEYKRKVYRLLALYEIADNELSSVNFFITNHVDYPNFNIFKKLEKYFYKLAKLSFDRGQSINSLKSILSFLSTAELNQFVIDFESFMHTHSNRIEDIFREYKSSPLYGYIILQPEIIFVWFLLEKCEYKLTSNWSTFFDDEDLTIIKSAWGLID